MTRRKRPAAEQDAQKAKRPPRAAAGAAPKGTPVHASIDRLEGEVAVLLVEGEQRSVPRARLPEEAREGDVVDLATLQVDRAATEALREEVRAARTRAQQGKPPAPGGFDL